MQISLQKNKNLYYTSWNAWKNAQKPKETHCTSFLECNKYTDLKWLKKLIDSIERGKSLWPGNTQNAFKKQPNKRDLRRNKKIL